MPQSKTGKGRFKHAIKPKFTGHHKLLKQDKLHKLTCTIPWEGEGEGEGRLKHDVKPKFHGAQDAQQNSSSNITLHKLTCTTSRGKEGRGKVQARRKNRNLRGTARTTNSSSNIKLHKITCTKTRGKEGRREGQS